MAGNKVMEAYENGSIMAEFRSVTPPERDELVETAWATASSSSETPVAHPI